MLPGFTGILALQNSAPTFSFPSKASNATRAVALADLWTKTEPGSHEEPGGRVHCWSNCFCTLFVRWCRSECDNGEKGVWHADGACLGIGGGFWDLW
jgi:hypothetical protein